MPKKQTSERTVFVTLVRSPIGYTRDQKATALALGLRRMHQTIEHRDTPALRGMINKIAHLVQVEEAG
jgi:large subunit ribosomal protein L30